MQSRGNTRKCRRRTGDIPTLFQPRIPRRADTTELGGFFPPQPPCPTPSGQDMQSNVLWRQGVTSRAQKGSKGAVLFRRKVHDGGFYTSIK